MIKLMVLAASAAVMASAASAETLPQARISTSDLNLATAAGQKVLAARIEQAGATMCGTAYTLDLTQQRYVNECRAAVRRSAREQVRKAVIVAGAGSSMHGLAAQSAIVGG